ncbi:MAG TPA: general secretion pathway protein GspB [Marinobacter sp.]|nr:general secretion pathway protein GspB [Marinobacter sp.]
MSYILDALRKSESERHQGKVPDLGRQLQLIHRPAKRHWPVQVLLAVGLLLNAGVLAYVFWPDQDVSVTDVSAPTQSPEATTVNSASEPATVNSAPAAAAQNPVAGSEGVVAESVAAVPPPALIAEPILPSVFPSPTVIVPSGWGTMTGAAALSGANVPAGNAEGLRVPHLVELPLSFQRSVPDLTVNSHIFASVPQARRVTINNQNLRPGDSVQGLRVEEITEDGVVLSRQGQQFRLGIVRDWMTPR